MREVVGRLDITVDETLSGVKAERLRKSKLGVVERKHVSLLCCAMPHYSTAREAVNLKSVLGSEGLRPHHLSKLSLVLFPGGFRGGFFLPHLSSELSFLATFRSLGGHLKLTGEDCLLHLCCRLLVFIQSDNTVVSNVGVSISKRSLKLVEVLDPVKRSIEDTRTNNVPVDGIEAAGNYKHFIFSPSSATQQRVASLAMRLL
jgi:hypothetical protein